MSGRALRLGPDLFASTSGGEPLDSAIEAVFGDLVQSKLVGGADDGPSPRHSLELRVCFDRGGLRILAGDTTILTARSERSLAPLLEGALIGCAVRTRRDAAAFHAASVELAGRAVLLVGGKGHGKSTLALQLARQGARYLGDEVAFVSYQDATVDPFPKAITLKPGSFDETPDAETYFDPVRGPVRYQRVTTAVRPDGARIPIGAIVLIQYSDRVKGAEAIEVDPAVCALELVRQSFGGLERDRRLLPLIGVLSTRPSFGLTYGDSARAARTIADILMK